MTTVIVQRVKQQHMWQQRLIQQWLRKYLRFQSDITISTLLFVLFLLISKLCSYHQEFLKNVKHAL